MYTHTVANAVDEINTCVAGDDPSSLLETLHNQYAGLQNVQDAQALHYLNILKALRAAKAEVCVCQYIKIKCVSGYLCVCNGSGMLRGWDYCSDAQTSYLLYLVLCTACA